MYILMLAMVALISTGLLAMKSEAVNRYKNRYYVYAVWVTVAILLAQLLGHLGIVTGNIGVHLLANGITYSLVPFLPYLLIGMHRTEWKLFEKLLSIPAGMNLVLTLTTPWTHLYFYINGKNEFVREPGFLFLVLLVSVYLVILTHDSFQSYKDSDLAERIYLLLLVALIFIGIFFQLIMDLATSMWPTIAIVLVLYYSFILQMGSKYDSLTSVRNRGAFEKRKLQLTENKDYILVMIDINGLKTTNDKMGHAEGDLLIMDAARYMVASFSGIGRVFRIGGDEFCIICENASGFVVSAAISRLEKNLSKLNKLRNVPLNMAFGIGEHRLGDPDDFGKVFHVADEAMYKNKKAFYEKNMEYDRRADRD